MRALTVGSLLAIVAAATVPGEAMAQLERRPPPGGESRTRPGAGAPRDPRYPFAGLWRGLRTTEAGTDLLTLEFTVTGDAYAGRMLTDGGAIPQAQLEAKDGELRWEQPNSGGGRWRYVVRLAGRDSLVGTLRLEGAPEELRGAAGTLALVRQVPAGR